jgi:hypothetical protein
MLRLFWLSPNFRGREKATALVFSLVLIIIVLCSNGGKNTVNTAWGRTIPPPSRVNHIDLVAPKSKYTIGNYSSNMVMNVLPHKTVVFPGGHKAEVHTGSSIGAFDKFWDLVSEEKWELNTFSAFQKYINNTVDVIDFGSW